MATELDWDEGTCDQCGHERQKTQTVDGVTWCIICLEERNRENGEGVSR